MSMKSIVAVGCLSAMAAIGLVHASGSAAAESNQSGLMEERVGHGGSMYYKGGQVSGCTVSAAEQDKGQLVEARVGHGGSMYYQGGQFSGCTVSAEGQNGGKLVEERVGHGGSVYHRQSGRQAMN